MMIDIVKCTVFEIQNFTVAGKGNINGYFDTDLVLIILTAEIDMLMVNKSIGKVSTGTGEEGYDRYRYSVSPVSGISLNRCHESRVMTLSFRIESQQIWDRVGHGSVIWVST